MNQDIGPHQMKHYGKTFHLASRFLNTRHAHAAAQLYAICRTIDDIADLTDDPNIARTQLTNLYKSIESSNRSDPLVAAFLDIQPAVQASPLLDLISGVLSDLEVVRIQTTEELHLYAYRVAGTVGMMMCDVFGVTDPDARAYATDLGIAMQMTNIARDVLEDAESNRRYLPGEWLNDIGPQEIIAPSIEQRLNIQSSVLKLLRWADDLYESGLRGLPALPTRARLGVLIAARAYREIGISLINNNCNIWQGRTVVSKVKKTSICIHALVSFNTIPKLNKRAFRLSKLPDVN